MNEQEMIEEAEQLMTLGLIAHAHWLDFMSNEALSMGAPIAVSSEDTFLAGYMAGYIHREKEGDKP